MQRQNRILWLINHTTLREFEVPLLLDLGFEVYIPKKFPQDEANRSASISYKFDESLSIPAELLKVLNNHDFYSTKINAEIEIIINKYFSSTIIAFFPFMVREMVEKFKGNIFLRVFGLAEAPINYYKILQSELSSNFIHLLNATEDRVWFAQAYKNLSDIEPDFFANRAVTLPLGLPKKMWEKANTWNGKENKILFVCPRIKSSPNYYGVIYNRFIKDLGDFPYVIAGAQPLKVKDPNVLGFQEREEYDKYLQNCRVMFYHSEEPRHLHYHPLEAMIIGMPVIFMAKGMLGRNHIEQPGACIDMTKAREKIHRVLNGDEKLISDIVREQKKILVEFSYESCRKAWEKNFLKIIKKEKEKKNIKKIAVFLPIPYRGGSLNGAKNVAKMICLGSRRNDEEVEVVFSCVKDAYSLTEEFADLYELNINVRETEWVYIKGEEIIKTWPNTKSKVNFEKTYQYPRDGIINFTDCDYWVIISDRTFYPLAPIKPYSMVIYDYIQRYIPNLLGDSFESSFLESARKANFILTTTPSTRLDAINYAGISPEKVVLAPMEFNPLKTEYEKQSVIKKNYIIWTSNLSIHKNHVNTLKALKIYYEKYDGALEVWVTGVETEYLDVALPFKKKIFHIQEARKLIKENHVLKKNLKVLGELSFARYIKVLREAQFLLHPVIYDNGTFSVIEAAYHNTPSVSSNYPQMKFISENFKLNLLFFEAENPFDIAEKIKLMEENVGHYQDRLPSKSFLENFTTNELAQKYWDTIKVNL